VSSLGRTVRRMARQSFEVVRRGGTYDSNGTFRRSRDPGFCAKGNVQPSTPRDLEQLPEGSRSQGSISIWGCFRTDTGASVDLQLTGPGDDGSGQMGDRISYDGIEYEVRAVARWARHTKYICTRAQQ